MSILTHRLDIDYEIFRLRDELAATEGANVTFYGTWDCLLLQSQSVSAGR